MPSYPPSDSQATAWAQQLHRDGYVVIGYTDFELASLQREFDATLRSFPEYVPGATQYVGGGFGALANPASFHNPFVRDLRERAMAAVLPVFSALSPGTRFAHTIDRMMVRTAGQAPSAETWHRDVSPSPAGTRVFGGWINLDAHPQYFSCVRATHTSTSGSGFAKLSKQDAAHYTALRKLGRDPVVRVAIPPAHILIFSENLIHEVYPAKAKYTMRRLFLGWTLGQPIHASKQLKIQLRHQTAVTLKSGQTPRLWPRLYWVNFPDKLESLALNFREDLRESRTVQSGKRRGQRFRIVPESLAGTRAYKSYSRRERRMLFPHRHWKLKHPSGKHTIRIKI
mgnify:CR=1 FL=1